MTERKRWTVDIDGWAESPEGDKISVIRHDPPQIHLEIDAPWLRSAGAEQKQLARQAIQDALTALQEALDSPSELLALDPQKTRR